ncbi:MAG: hypothetical protein LBB88_01665 [Planctomycetaceae bacterium]|jgi:TIGR03009 family protein|nr:hypothetical protein [Planctomycetaceae bacterium]
MKFTFATLFAGFALLLFVTNNNLAQQPAATPYQPINGGTLQSQPMQTPPKNVTVNGVTTFQNQPLQPNQPTAGFNSPFPTNLVPPNNTTPNVNPNQPSNFAQPSQPSQPSRPNQPSLSSQPLQPKQPANPYPYNLQPSPYQPNPNQPNGQPNANLQPNQNLQPNPTFQPYPNPNPNLNPNQPNVARDNRFPSGGRVVHVADASGAPRIDSTRNELGHHVGSSTPAVRVHPFVLKPEEQKELDEFLLRWERYSESISNYEVDFNAFFYDSTNPLSPPITANEPQLKPLKITFGYFKYIAPRRFVYHVEGEWKQKERVKYIDPEITPNVTAEKTIINDQSLYFYDFPAKTVTQHRIPPEELNRTIANGPFPLIFGAKAADMKKRFSMKIVSNPDYKDKDKEIWLWIVPLLHEDQQEFSKIETRLDKRSLNALAIRQIDPTEKAYISYVLQNPIVNNRFARLGDYFNPDVPRGWKHEIKERTTINPNLNVNPNPNPNPNPTTQPRTEVNLYKP